MEDEKGILGNKIVKVFFAVVMYRFCQISILVVEKVIIACF